MRKTKRVLSVVLCLVMLLAVVPVMNLGIKANAGSLTWAEFNDKLDEVRETYPHGTNKNTYEWSINDTVVGWECHGYGRWISWYVWGEDFKNGNGTDWSRLEATSTTSPAYSVKPGDVVRYRNSANHTIFVTSVTDDGIYFTDNNRIAKNTIAWDQYMSKAELASKLMTKLYKPEDEASSTQYGYIAHYDYNNLSPAPTTAPTYATISTNRYSYEVNERVYFTMSSNGTKNNLWIYCPNGQTLTYEDVGTEYDLGFGMSGEFEALVQTWNGVGSFTSERVHFLVGNPTRAILTTNYTSYAVNERVYFTCDTNGSPNCNTLWIYCPNGTTLHYSDIGTEYDLGFGMSGEFEALVQAWSRTGSLTSERIRFVVGPPTRASITTNKNTYNVNEEVTFTCDTNGSANSNTLWIYCPDGTSKSYTKVGTSFKVTLEQPGTYEALVQAWNRVGSLSSERVSFEILSNHSHSYTASITKAATCSTIGVKTFTCSCGASYTEPIPINASNHVNTTNTAATPSTCTVKGYTAGVYCNDCKKYISGHQEQPLAAHQTETRNARAATCSAEGYTGDQYCTVCKQTISTGTAIGKKAHTLTTINQKNADCTTAGYTGDQYCTVCKQTISKGSMTNALGHTSPDGNGNCTRCGTHIKDVTPTQPTQPQTNPNACKWCGKVHNGNFFDRIVGFFHSILAIFKR